MEIQKASCHDRCYDLIVTIQDKFHLIEFMHSDMTDWSYVECRDGLCEETIDGGPHVTLEHAVEHALTHEKEQR